MKKSIRNKAFQNYLVDITALVPFTLLLASGVIMLIYHSGISGEQRIMMMNKEAWLLFHRYVSLIALPLVMLHMYFHWNIIMKLFRPAKGKASNRSLNLSLFGLFITTSLTAIISWFFVNDDEGRKLLVDIHNKLGMALIVFYGVHLALHLGWIIRMTRKLSSD